MPSHNPQRDQTTLYTIGAHKPGAPTVGPEQLGEPIVIPVTAEHHVVHAWQTVRSIAESDGFGQVPTYYVITSVAELANNLVLHTSRGGTISVVRV